MRSSVWFALALTGCTQLLGADDFEKKSRASDAGSADASAPDELVTRLEQCGGFAYKGDACGACLEMHCCDQATACANEPACGGLSECAAGCGSDDDTCSDGCATRLGGILSSLARFESVQCSVEFCSEACALDCGLNEYRKGCLQRQRGYCEAERAVLSDRDALDWVHCWYNCGWYTRWPQGDPCGCDARYGRPSEGTAMIASQGACLPIPGDDPDWSCLGSIVDLSHGPDEFELNLLPLDLLTGARLPGLTVTQCRYADLQCGHAADDPRTEEDPQSALYGAATLNLRRRGLTSNEYFGYLWISGESVPDTAAYFASTTGFLSHPFYGLVTKAVERDVFAGAGSVRDPSEGWMGLGFYDCAGALARGVSVEVLRDSGARGSGKIVYPDASGIYDMAADRTSASGLVSVLELSPGPVSIRATRADTGEIVAERTVVIRANAFTSVAVKPTRRKSTSQ